MATTVEVAEAPGNRINVSGALTFATARRAREAGLKAMASSQSQGTLVVDCAGVKESDSAGLAVLIDWLANATARGRGVQFANLPPPIVAAARISDVDSLLNA